MSRKLPAMPLYIGDLKKDPGWQALSLEEKGAWLEIIMLMWESNERGKLALNGRKVSIEVLSRIFGESVEKTEKIVETLLYLGVASVDENGLLCNRRMIRDEDIRCKRASAGRLGWDAKDSKNNKSKEVKEQASEVLLKQKETISRPYGQANGDHSETIESSKPTPPSLKMVSQVFQQNVESSDSSSYVLEAKKDDNEKSSTYDFLLKQKETILTPNMQAKGDHFTETENEIENENERKRGSGGKGKQIGEIFEFWKEATENKNSILDSERKKWINSALGFGFTTERIKNAIQGFLKFSDWHMGKNDTGDKWEDLKYILKDAATMEKNEKKWLQGLEAERRSKAAIEAKRREAIEEQRRRQEEEKKSHNEKEIDREEFRYKMAKVKFDENPNHPLLSAEERELLKNRDKSHVGEILKGFAIEQIKPTNQ